MCKEIKLKIQMKSFSKKGKIPGVSDEGGEGDKSAIAKLAQKKSAKLENKTDAWDKYKNR